MLRKRVQYFKENLEQGQGQRLFDDIRKLVASLGMSVRDALDALEVPKENRERYLAMLGEANPSR